MTLIRRLNACLPQPPSSDAVQIIGSGRAAWSLLPLLRLYSFHREQSHADHRACSGLHFESRPGFDIFGLALSLYSVFTFERSEALQISGCPEAFQNEDNLVLQGFREIFREAGQTPFPVKLHIDAEVPVARGWAVQAPASPPALPPPMLSSAVPLRRTSSFKFALALRVTLTTRPL